MRLATAGIPSALVVGLTLGLATAGAAGPSAPTPAPLPDARLGVRTAPILLLSRPDVRADLGLNARLAEGAEQALSDLYVRAAGLKGKTGDQAVAARKAIDDAQREWFDTHMTPEQRSRLLQIDLQWEGPSALVSRAIVADTLSLAPEQRAALVEAVKARNAARARPTYSQADEQALARKALTVLTPRQKELWRTMLGAPFAPRLASPGAEARPRR